MNFSEIIIETLSTALALIWVIRFFDWHENAYKRCHKVCCMGNCREWGCKYFHGGI